VADLSKRCHRVLAVEFNVIMPSRSISPLTGTTTHSPATSRRRKPSFSFIFTPPPFISSIPQAAENTDSTDFIEVQEEVPVSMKELEMANIKSSLDRNNGKRRKTARELGISERTLYRKIKEYNLQ
jgi:DNA-binding NtrC family response regulator